VSSWSSRGTTPSDNDEGRVGGGRHGLLAVTPEARLQHALDLAYRYLGHRDRTVVELRRHLEAKRVEPATIDASVAELERVGYLDDARYAQRFAEDRRTMDAWGADRIERRLLAAGVAPGLVEAALDARDTVDEHEAALAVLRRRYPQPPATDRDRDRALSLLVRKGYQLDLAYDAVRAFERGAD
jgi:regulatory protein